MSSVLLLLVACLGPTEKGFPDSYAETLCRYDEHCHKSVFVEDYDDIDECVDEIMDRVDDGADCAFDTDEARTCLREMRDARQDCDDGDRIPEACYDAFDCAGVLPSKLSAETYFGALLDVYCSLDCGSSYIDDICANPEQYASTDYDCPEFDIDKAEECLDPSNWECRDDYYENGGVPVPPQACNEVCYGGYDYTDTTYTY